MPMTPDLYRPTLRDDDDAPAFAPDPDAATRQSSLNRLATLLRIADGAWAMAVYRSPAIRSQMIDELTARLAPLPVVALALVDRPDRLFDYLRQLPPDAPPMVLFCHSYGDGLPALLRSLDLQRDVLARLPHRLVFWVNQFERSRFLELAPNFASRLSGTFQFPGEGLTGAPSLALVTPPHTSGGGESGASTARRRPYLPVRNARHRAEQIDYLQRRIHDLQQLLQRDDEAIGDAWYDLAGLLESGEPQRWAEAEAAYAEAARAYAGAGRSLAEAEARYRAGDAIYRAYQPAPAHEHLARALHQYRLLSDTMTTTPEAVLGEANVQKALGDLALREADLGEARRRYEAALTIYPVIGARLGEANVNLSLGDLCRQTKDPERAWRHYLLAQRFCARIQDRYSVARVLYRQGDWHAEQGHAADARGLYVQAIELWSSIGLANLADQIIVPRLHRIDI